MALKCLAALLKGRNSVGAFKCAPRVFTLASALFLLSSSVTPAEAFSVHVNYTPEFGGQVPCEVAGSAACFRWSLSNAGEWDYVMTRQWMYHTEVISGIITDGVPGWDKVLLSGHGEEYDEPIIRARYAVPPTASEFDCVAPLSEGCSLPVLAGQDIHYTIQPRAIGMELIYFYVYGD
ncbi:TPA: hypothetical protein UM343_001535 [Stenotrophomonas maltophilia]|nr:hypothetical protein [Stenotrophomonas maltophilia]